jgi:hypothetical protein
VLGAGQPALAGREHGGCVIPHKSCGVEPKTGKDLAAIEAGFVELKSHVGSLPQNEPVDLVIEHHFRCRDVPSYAWHG